MKPVTGVTNLNESASEWFWDAVNDGIEPGYEEARLDLIKEFIGEHESDEDYREDDGLGAGYDADQLLADAEEHADRELENWESEGMILVGDWDTRNDPENPLAYPTYEPDTSGKWAGIYRRDSGNILQVVWSRWGILGAWCSPCYPNQVDADTEGGVLGYFLPPDELDEKWLEENRERLVEIEE